MRLDAADIGELRPVIREAALTILAELESRERPLHPARLAYTEPEAAALVGVAPHVLRDCRLRGELQASRVGKKMVYERAELLEWLRRQRM